MTHKKSSHLIKMIIEPRSIGIADSGVWLKAICSHHSKTSVIIILSKRTISFLKERYQYQILPLMWTYVSGRNTLPRIELPLFG